MGVKVAASVEGFFHEMVNDALSTCGVRASDATTFYLVGLLGEFAHARISDEPLSIMYLEAEQGGRESVSALKEVGDTSLYVAGFFAESLERRTVAPQFYMGLGGAAYGSLARRLSSSSAASVYRELAASFPRLVEVLAAVRSQVTMDGTEKDALGATWLTPPTADLVEALKAYGIPCPSENVQ